MQEAGNPSLKRSGAHPWDDGQGESRMTVVKQERLVVQKQMGQRALGETFSGRW